MRIVRSSDLPKPSPSFSLSLAATVPGRIVDLADRFRTKPYRYKQGRDEYASHYRCIYFQLTSGAFAAVSEEEEKPDILEISLQIEDAHIFREEDLRQLAAFLDIDVHTIKKWRGGEKWLAGA